MMSDRGESIRKDLFDLSGKTALITGGSRGLGLQIAEALGAYGARIMLSSRKSAQLQHAQIHLQSLGITADWIAADVGNESQIVRLADEALERLGHVDILVNNSGASWGSPAEDHPTEAWDKLFNLNVRGLFLITQQIGRRSMIPRRAGRILNIASVAGLRGNPPGQMKTIGYNTSKGAVVNFTRALAGEWGHYGITVNALAPFFFRTKLSQGLIEHLGHDKLSASTALGRLGNDEDLKGAALLFASDAGSYITGQVLAVDGGYSAI